MGGRAQDPSYLADFHDCLKRIQIPAVDLRSLREQGTARTRHFVPTDELSQYLTEKAIKNLLAYHHRPSIEWESIRSNYLAIFAILIHIEKGTYITHFIRHDLVDSRLPFLSDCDWPSDCRQFFSKFYSAQWKFCAKRLDKDRLKDTHFHEDVIIPITSFEALHRGPYSCTYKVDIHPTYIPLDVSQGTRRTTNTFVLKTCREKDAEIHQNEVEAYNIMGGQNDVVNNMARFYGSWHQGQEYNMLLEYVGGGTLEEFFERNEPPDRGEESLRFWENMAQLAAIVARIHMFPNPDNHAHYQQGIHHDIKASNILVSTPTGPSKFDVTFKLADFGMAHFEYAARKGIELRRRDLGGTQIFSAPESFRDENDRTSKYATIDAKPSKDIWSLGCVYSQAAVWSVLGRKGLREYRHVRVAATVPRLQSTAYKGCFHDGERVLPEVTAMHIRVRKSRRHDDMVIHETLTIIDEMLDEAASRPNGRKIHSRLLRILQNATTMSHDSGPTRQSVYYPQVYNTDADAPATREQPPESPPNFDEVGLGIMPSSSAHSKSGINAPTVRNSALPIFPSSATGFSQPSGFEKALSHTPAPFANGTPSGKSQQRQRRYSNASSNGTPPRRPFSHPPVATPITAPPPNGGQTTNGLGTAEIRHRHNVSAPFAGSRADEVLDINSKPQPPRPKLSLSRPEPPRKTIKEVEGWIRTTKICGPLARPLYGYEYLRRLDGRDHIFLFDDSSSMKPYWNDVKRTFDALAYLVKRKDPDGIEIRFTNRPSLVGRCKDRDPLRRLINSVEPASQCDIGHTLGNILGDMSHEGAKGVLGGRILWRKKKRHVNIYVLTDGVWEAGEGWLESIVDSIKRLVEKGMQKRELGIQFIQFGNDEEGTRRLQTLDDHLGKEGITQDFIDTEHWKGNVYKMLLGAIDRDWDVVGTPQSSSRPDSEDTQPPKITCN